MRASLLVIIFIIPVTAWAATPVIKNIENTAKDNVQLLRIVCDNGAVLVKGRAQSNSKVSAFMRALDTAGFGATLISLEQGKDSSSLPILFFMKLANSNKLFPNACDGLPVNYEGSADITEAGSSKAVAGSPARDDGWPGLSPDCWSEPRLVHGGVDVTWKNNISFSHIKTAKPKTGIYSPNKGYFFVQEGTGRPDARLIIHAEKDYLIEVKFSRLFGLNEIKWINEKLLFIQPWWGKIAATDIIYDVEAEKIIYAERVTDGVIAYRQFQEVCPQHGCECIKKK